jgi:hypothetical protein
MFWYCNTSNLFIVLFRVITLAFVWCVRFFNVQIRRQIGCGLARLVQRMLASGGASRLYRGRSGHCRLHARLAVLLWPPSRAHAAVRDHVLLH